MNTPERSDRARSTNDGAAPTSRSTRSIGFLAGVGYALRGARFVYVQHPRLSRLWLPPVVITAIALIATTWAAFAWRDDVVGWLWPEPGGSGAGAIAARGLHTALELLAAVLMALTGVVVVALASSLICAPFNDALSEAVERIHTGGEGTSLRLSVLLRDTLRSIGLQLLKLGAYAAIMGPMFVISFALPGVGGVLYTAIAFVVTALFLAIDYVDFAATRRGLDARARMRAALRQWPAMLGLGAAIWVLLFVPLLNVLFMPAAVAGGTLLFLDLHPAPGVVDPAR
jgi:CysZ protein